ncbi:MAG: hypothetical protein PHV82_10555 [Victivallaceae bacterium]|nr:hypothetical protein [Victivallaceae bacterium]
MKFIIKSLIPGLCLTTLTVFGQLPQIPAKISNDYQEALLENQHYKTVKTKLDALQKQEKKFVFNHVKDQPARKRELEEYYKIREALATPGKLSAEELTDYSRKLYGRLRKAFQAVCLESPELAELQARKHILNAQMAMIMITASHNPADERIIAYNREQQKFIDAGFANQTQSLPKANVPGSDEFKAAMRGAELSEKDPLKYKWAMVRGLSSLMRKVTTAAEAAGPELKELAYKRNLASTEMSICTAQIDRKNIALYQKTFALTPAAMKARQELRKIYREDAEYQRLQQTNIKIYKEYQQALEAFIAKSDLPMVDEYRRFKAIMDKLSKNTPPAPTVCSMPQKLDFSGLFKTTKYLRKDYEAREKAMFNKYLEQESPTNKATARELFLRSDEKKITAFLKSNDLSKAPVTEFFLRTQLVKENQYNLVAKLKLYPLVERIIAANPGNRDEGQIILNRTYKDFRRYPPLIATLKKIAKMPAVDAWVREIAAGRAATYRGWAARGHGFANTVSQDGWKSFGNQLKIAKAHYHKALAIDPNRPEPAGALSGSPNPQSEALKNFRIATAIEADNPTAFGGLLNCFRLRWGGSGEMSYKLAAKCYESPLKDSRLGEYGIRALVNGAYENRDRRAWQRGVRSMPKIKEALAYLRQKVKNEPDPIKKEEAQIQEISLLFALGQYDEVKEKYLSMTPARFKSALSRMDRKRVLVPGWSNSYFHWIKYVPAVKAFTGKYGQELRDAENDFIAGKNNQALSKLEAIIKQDDLAENDRQYMLYLYGHWMLNISPSVSRTSISIIEPWQLEL